MPDWFAQNWYLVIPWISGVGAWLVARHRQSDHPIRWGVAFFLLGGLVVLALDLAPMLMSSVPRLGVALTEVPLVG